MWKFFLLFVAISSSFLNCSCKNLTEQSVALDTLKQNNVENNSSLKVNKKDENNKEVNKKLSIETKLGNHKVEEFDSTNKNHSSLSSIPEHPKSIENHQKTNKNDVLDYESFMANNLEEELAKRNLKTCQCLYKDFKMVLDKSCSLGEVLHFNTISCCLECTKVNHKTCKSIQCEKVFSPGSYCASDGSIYESKCLAFKYACEHKKKIDLLYQETEKDLCPSFLKRVCETKAEKISCKNDPNCYPHFCHLQQHQLKATSETSIVPSNVNVSRNAYFYSYMFVAVAISVLTTTGIVGYTFFLNKKNLRALHSIGNNTNGPQNENYPSDNNLSSSIPTYPSDPLEGSGSLELSGDSAPIATATREIELRTQNFRQNNYSKY